MTAKLTTVWTALIVSSVVMLALTAVAWIAQAPVSAKVLCAGAACSLALTASRLRR